ncbi:phospho-2-dehydro-3-deoxyheptonate aldolase [Phenylobacterium sp. Root77]|uniref:3-deoxy-7-phosphoheptulonate synthase n=1 Tax=unclassified Phenylobacterium TaxID=2640670 RepID=UPI0007013145|nr:MULTISPECIES: 3-deoxy-7-phosphoheptulonate synthase [unclassified Phenylobacterium]KQW71592.1 phospho-2-dehydro-3-deoxyheptonate aldolase [Phenylobacterium sp. Root1277]KQW94512.1 phospho-2-dehydro-3-deoxyheptonate aldolase [Phenylobacterium sp. Root1290]KRC44206.1 phospho-2-dehydro-3-deoxyheptonate aldolase [Phenylobacterium sp. Root77]
MTTDDLRIIDIKPLASPAQVMGDLPASDDIGALVSGSRHKIHQILHGSDDRLVVVIGPCSIHDPAAAMDYARRLAAQRARFEGQLEIVMRVYFEKPRTTVGWKGLINDPHLDGTFRIDEGLPLARKLLLEVNALGLPAAVEFLDVTTPQYLADLVAWGAIGARTTESQIHREMASGLSCPIGFKNGTDGNLRIAVDAVKAASQPHHFLAIGKDGRAAIAATRGNDDSHVVLRGGKTPNYDAAGVAAACAELAASGLRQSLIIDVSHANSSKKPENQPAVTRDVAAQVSAGDQRIAGVMIESHLVAGRQDLVDGQPLVYGQSITDGCIDWDTSVELLEELAMAVEARRRVRAASPASETAKA